MSKKKPEPSGDVDRELSIDDLKSVVGGIVEITTTDDQTIRWNLSLDGSSTLSYNHLDGSTRTVKVNKVRRLKK
jgi:hypothetical protein